MKYILIIFFNVLFLSGYAQQADFNSKIRKMIKLQGIEQSWSTIINKMVDMKKVEHPEIDKEFWVKFEKDIVEKSYDRLYEFVIPIYKKYFTEEEVDTILAFYETDAGKSLINKTPLILQESKEADRKLGEEMAVKIIEKVEFGKNEKFDKVYSGCDKFKEGRFKFIMPDSSEVIIERDGKYQYEHYKNNTTKYVIEWLNGCRYQLYIDKEDMDLRTSTMTKKVIANIYEVGEDYYKFVSGIEGESYKLDGRVEKVE